MCYFGAGGILSIVGVLSCVVYGREIAHPEVMILHPEVLTAFLLVLPPFFYARREGKSAYMFCVSHLKCGRTRFLLSSLIRKRLEWHVQ